MSKLNNIGLLMNEGQVTIDTESNSISLYDEVNQKTAAMIIDAINNFNDTYDRNVATSVQVLVDHGIEVDLAIEKAMAKHKIPILFYINTLGGSLVDTLTIVNSMKNSSLPIITICNGYAYSAGFMLFIHGAIRILNEDAELMYHQLLAGTSGNHTDMQHQMDNLNRYAKKLRKMVMSNTQITEEQLILWDREQLDVFMEYEQAVKFGVCDSAEIIEEKFKAIGVDHVVEMVDSYGEEK